MSSSAAEMPRRLTVPAAEASGDCCPAAAEMSAAPRVAVMGAGVCGVGAALAILQTVPRTDVTIITTELTPHTTGDGAAGIWGPHYVIGHPEKIRRWGQATHDLLQRLWQEGDCPGIGLVSGLDAPESAPHNTVPFYHEDAPESAAAATGASASDGDAQRPPASNHQQREAARDAQQPAAPNHQQREAPSDPQPAELSSTSPERRRLSRQVTLYAEPSKLLPFLLARFRDLGGRVVTGTVSSLHQLAGYDVIINCTGLGAAALVGDQHMVPVRGQLVRVRAPFVKSFLARGEFYIVPNDECVVLGGTRQVGDWRRVPDAMDTARIVAGCCQLVPALRTAPRLGVWAGLRPMRTAGVRLEAEQCMLDGRRRLVVHNYGHGGAGVTLFWGCALEVAALVRRHLQTGTTSPPTTAQCSQPQTGAAQLHSQPQTPAAVSKL